MRKLSVEEILDKLREIHQGRYDYSLAKVGNTQTAIEIVCEKHGSFWLSPVSHYYRGCPHCGNELKRGARKGTWESFMERAEKAHPGKYAYDKGTFKGVHAKMRITCPVHGDFWQIPKDHIRAHPKIPAGCPKCGIESRVQKVTRTTDEFIKEARKVHGSLFDYTHTEYVRSPDLVEIACPVHGPFIQIACNHLLGQGCPLCGVARRVVSRTFDTDKFIKLAREAHGDRYDYSRVAYRTSGRKVTIGCPEHGWFEQVPSHHWAGSGCKKCSFDALADRRRRSMGDVVNRFREVHGDLYEYPEFDYTDTQQRIVIVCKQHGAFTQRVSDHTTGNGCQKCAARASTAERELREFVLSLPVESVFNDRSGLAGTGLSGNHRELDVLFPGRGLAIELDGIYWHSSRPTTKKEPLSKCHLLEKTLACKEKGIRLIHYYCDEWKYRKEQVKQHIRSVLGLLEGKVAARECSVAEVPGGEAKGFLDAFHIQGSVNSSHRPGRLLGLYRKGGGLVALMAFSSVVSRRGQPADPRHWELTRFATSVRVVGGASKLLAHFIRATPEAETVVSYSDRRISQGNLYEKLGFAKAGEVRPDYMYVTGRIRSHKSNFTKDRIRKKYPEVYSPDKTEREMTEELKLYRVYNCGLDKWQLNLSRSQNDDCETEG